LIGLFAIGCVFLAVGCTPSDTETTPTDTPTATDTTTTPTLGEMQTIDNLDGITVSGDSGTEPTVDSAYPFNVTKTLCKTLIEGTGAEVGDSSILDTQYVGINASTGETFDSSWSRGQSMVGQMGGSWIAGWDICLKGQKDGGRVLMAITGADGYDDMIAQGQDPGAGISSGDTLVFVVDILAVEYTGPQGQHLADGNQWATVTDKDGIPTVSLIPGTTAPTDLQVNVLIQGTGRPVLASDLFVGDFIQIDFATGKEIDNSFTDGSPSPYAMLANLIPGLRTAIEGQPLGSRLLVIVPGAQAYPAGNATPSVSPNATLVFLIDILFSCDPASLPSSS